MAGHWGESGAGSDSCKYVPVLIMRICLFLLTQLVERDNGHHLSIKSTKETYTLLL